MNLIWGSICEILKYIGFVVYVGKKNVFFEKVNWVIMDLKF